MFLTTGSLGIIFGKRGLKMALVLSPEQKDIYNKAYEILRSKWPCLLEGETGVGKNFILDLIGRKLGLEVVRCNLSLNTTVEDLWGKDVLKTGPKGNTISEFEPGPALTALERGQFLLLDEVNAALPEVLFSLHGLLEVGRKSIYVPQLKRTVDIHPDFRISATMNPSEDYVGTRELNQAFMSRFLVLQMPELSDSGLACILESIFTDVPKSTVLEVVKTITQVKEFLDKEGSVFRVSLRDAMKITQLNRCIGSLSESANIVFSSVISRFPSLPNKVPALKHESIFEVLTIADMIDMYANIKRTSEFVKSEVPQLESIVKAIAKE